MHAIETMLSQNCPKNPEFMPPLNQKPKKPKETRFVMLNYFLKTKSNDKNGIY